MSDYHPTFDQPHPDLPAALDELRERLAEHVHDVWAAGRLADGWVLGPARNDERKEHPNLVPYEVLSEQDKAIDRATAEATLRFILAHGWQIRPPHQEG